MTHPLPDFRDPSPAAMEVSSALELQPHPEGGATVSFGGMPPRTEAGAPQARSLFLKASLIALAAFFLAPYLLTALYVFIDPPFSALMLRQALTGGQAAYEWRDLDQISPNLIAQVIAAEDGRFCKHHGVDWTALDRAADAVVDGKPKGGGSTITMQTAKNLFLWNRPAILRKPFEIPLAAFKIWRSAKAASSRSTSISWNGGRAFTGRRPRRSITLGNPPPTSRRRKQRSLPPRCRIRSAAMQAIQVRARWRSRIGFA